MQQLSYQRNKEPISALIGRSTVSCILVIFTQFALSLVPRFFSASSLLLQLFLSGSHSLSSICIHEFSSFLLICDVFGITSAAVLLLLVLGFGRLCKRLLGVYSSPPAFVVCNIIFLWLVYFVFVRQATPYFIDVMFHGEVAMLFVGLHCILSSNPGFVNIGSLNVDDEMKAFEVGSSGLKRIRFCKSCKAYVKGYDHHCPAFGNCIGKNNHALFMVLLLGFLCSEATYIMCSFWFIRTSHVLDGTINEIDLAGSLVVSTFLFTILQVLWQGFFMAWHVYCVCFNIKTDEWINWKKYPEFQTTVQSQPGESFSIPRYTNPYDKGIIQNLKEFLARTD